MLLNQDSVSRQKCCSQTGSATQSVRLQTAAGQPVSWPPVCCVSFKVCADHAAHAARQARTDQLDQAAQSEG